MDILIKLLIFLAASLSLTGCYVDFEPDIESTPVLCMNSLIKPSEPVRVELTRTWRWDEGPAKDRDITVTDAEVTLTVNGGAYTETLRHESEAWVADYLPSPGDMIELSAVSEKYGPATASVTVPMPVAIDSVSVRVSNFSRKPGSSACRFDLALLIYFTDPADAQNQYEFDVSSSQYIHDLETDALTYVGGYWLITDREPLFTEHVSALESTAAATSGYTIFSDRQISGKTYPLNIGIEDVTYDYYNPIDDPDIKPGYFNLTLSAVSRSYYDHVISVWVANDGVAGALGSVGLGEAVFPASNVSTRAGVVAATAPVTWKLDLETISNK